MSLKKIVITAGHGGKDPGAVNGRITEADLMVKLRNAVGVALQDLGYTVFKDGNGMENLPLTQAIRMIPTGAIAVELHTNASDKKSAAGVEVISLPRHKAISQVIAKNIADTLSIPIRRELGWYEYSKTGRTLGFVRAGGIIVETFFISNDSELKTFQEKLWPTARAIANAIHESCSACRA